MAISESEVRAARAELSDLQKKHIEQLGSPCNTAQSVAASGLEGAYRLQAILSFVSEGDRDGFFHAMYLAAAVRRRFLRCVRRGMRARKSDLLLSRDAGIQEALCSGEARVLHDLVRDKLTLESDRDEDSTYAPLFALGVRLMCMGQHEKAKDPLQAFERERGASMEPQSRIARAVLDSDFVLFNDGLAALLREGEAALSAEDETVPGVERLLSVEGLALARLGALSGIPVTVESPLLPKALLGAANKPYPDEEVLWPPVPASFTDALGDADSLMEEEAE
ncbi:MAG: hypothetical protein U0441_24525 [Polyangiaceae bacterium]